MIRIVHSSQKRGQENIHFQSKIVLVFALKSNEGLIERVVGKKKVTRTSQKVIRVRCGAIAIYIATKVGDMHECQKKTHNEFNRYN